MESTRRGKTARAAVPMSMASTPYKGRRPMSRAPSSGAKMLSRPDKVRFNPARRAKCCLGTISEVEAVMAEPWNALPSEWISRIA